MSRNRAHYTKSHSYSHQPANETLDEPFEQKANKEMGDEDDENHIEECLKRCFSVLNEIYDIAQTHPHVLGKFLFANWSRGVVRFLSFFFSFNNV
jgi:hypothetical protein